MCRVSILALLSLVALPALFASASSASSITYSFGGIVDVRSANLAGVVEVDDSVVVTIELDLTSVDSDARPVFGVYDPGTISSYSVVVDGATLVTAAAGTLVMADGYFNTPNKWYEDVFQPYVAEPSYFTSGPVAGMMPASSQVNLWSVGPSNPDTFTSDALPLVSPDPADFYSFHSRHSFVVYFGSFDIDPDGTPQANAYVSGRLVSIVPEPGTRLLVMASMAGLWAGRGARRA